MKQIIALSDYKGFFGTKHYAEVYRGGMSKKTLKDEFSRKGYEVSFVSAYEAQFIDVHNIPVIYTSREDPDYRYKGYIEDIVFGLELRGAKTIPPFKILRATNNKVLMEQLRRMCLPEKFHVNTKYFGTHEDLVSVISDIEYPVIIKTADGAVSKGVYKANDQQSLLAISKRISRSISYKEELRDYIREFKHKGFSGESKNRKKFILQEYISSVPNDWKVLVYYNKYFVLRRQNRPGDFRASGSGLFSFDDAVDPRLLEAGMEIREALDIPMISLDLALKDGKVVLFEFQGVHFGTSTLEKSPYYYVKSNGNWQQVTGKSFIEEIYTSAIVGFLENKS